MGGGGGDKLTGPFLPRGKIWAGEETDRYTGVNLIFVAL